MELTEADKRAGLEVELEYAVSQRARYGRTVNHMTKTARERFGMWNKEVKRLEKELAKYPVEEKLIL